MSKRLAFPGLVTLAGLSLFTQACDNPARDKAELRVGQATLNGPGAPAVQGSERYTFDAGSSKVSWVGSKVTGSQYGGFERFEGSIELLDGKADGGRVSVKLDARSLVSDNAKLTGHLKSADFFDVERYPEISFVSTSVKADPGGKGHLVSGNLSLHGVTKAVSFPAKLRVGPNGVEADAEFSFNRRDFGINYAGMANDLIRDEVLVRLAIRAQRSAS